MKTQATLNSCARHSAHASTACPAPYRGLLLGWEKTQTPSLTPHAAPAPILYDGDAPLLTCGMTGSGKGRGALIPALLHYPGPVIVADVKGELARVTARRRLEMGQRVVILDPCRLTASQSDGLNPLDLLTLPGANPDADAQMLATMLAAGHRNRDEPYWTDMAQALLGGLIAHTVTAMPPEARHLGILRSWLYHPDMALAIANALDKGEITSRFARDQLAGYLSAPEDRTRPCIHSTACSHINALCADEVAATLGRSTFPLRDVFDGKAMTIYLVMPADKLDSLRPLWRLWIGTLLTAVTRRPAIPRQRTLFLLDECAQLGELSALRLAVTLLRGAGLQVWSFWQDLSQLRQHYPQDWQTMIHNAAALQLLSVPNHLIAKEWAELLGMEAAGLARLAPEDAVVAIRGQDTRVVRRPDYLADPPFARLYDPNPRFALIAPGGIYDQGAGL